MASNIQPTAAIFAVGLIIVSEVIEPSGPPHFLHGIYTSHSLVALPDIAEPNFPFPPPHPSQYGTPAITGSIFLIQPWSQERVQPK